MSHAETIPCRVCLNPTHMLGTKLCDPCWELCSSIENAVNRGLIRRVGMTADEVILNPTAELAAALLERSP